MEQHYFAQALRFSGWAFEIVTFLPVDLLLVFAASCLLTAGLQQKPFSRHLWKPHHWLFLTHGLFFIAAILLAEFASVDPGSIYHPDQPATFWFYTVLCGSLISCTVWTAQMKGFRWFAASLMGMLQVFVLGALFVAGMSISGDWL